MLDLKGNKYCNESVFIKILFAVLLLRIAFAAWLPITGDEAYFVKWGKNVDYGFYDHSPFVGWLLTALITVSDATWWLRLPSILLPIFISFAIYRLLSTEKTEIAFLAAVSFLLAPVNLFNVLITTDTALIFFSFISSWYFYKSITESSSAYRNFTLSGLFLGLAFFSKYFAVVLGVTYALYILFFKRTKHSFIGLLIILLMVMPFVFVNIWWNYNNCWNNILFNLLNRTSVGTDISGNLLNYIVILAYLITPPILYYSFKNRPRRFEFTKQQHVYFWLFSFSLILFFIILFKKSIGLHWLLSFYPFMFIAASAILNVKQWKVALKFIIVISVIHGAVLSAILILPIHTFTSNKTTLQNFAFGKYPDKLLSQLNEYKEDYVFSTVSYGMASVASYYSDKEFIVFGEGSVHARQDDKLTNFKLLDGKNILFFKRSENYLDVYKKYFDSSERKKIFIDDVGFELFLGKGFKYELYRKDILEVVNKDFYSIPEWLPVGNCDFKEKYSLN